MLEDSYYASIYFRMSAKAGDFWTSKSPMLTPRAGLAAAVLGGKIYAIGGGITPPGGATSVVEEYDPGTDSWSSFAPLSTPRYDVCAVQINGKIYASGGTPGHGPYNVVEVYAPNVGSWQYVAPMPTARYACADAALNGKLYVIGGYRGDGVSFATVEEYTPGDNTWRTMTPMNTERVDPGAVTLDGKIYVMGGSGYAGPLNTVEVFDPAVGVWQEVAPMHTPRPTVACAVVNGKIYAVGGADTEPQQMLDSVEEYNPSTDSWRYVASMPTARYMYDGVVAVNDKVYAVGGREETGFQTSDKVEEYTPPRETLPATSESFTVGTLVVSIDIKPGSYPNSINLNSNGNVPVAIFSSDKFDATAIDPMTVVLAGATVKLKRQGTPMIAVDDVNDDGLQDLVVHIITGALELSETDTEATLDAETFEGVSVRGTDTVRIVPAAAPQLQVGETRLLAAFPAPANPEVWMPYHLNSAEHVLINIYDVQGRLVRALDIGHRTAGYYDTRTKAAYWDGRNSSGETVASGVYFYQLRTGARLLTRQLLVLR